MVTVIHKQNIERAMDKIMKYKELTKNEFWDLTLLLTWAIKEAHFINGKASFTVGDSIIKEDV